VIEFDHHLQAVKVSPPLQQNEITDLEGKTRGRRAMCWSPPV